jgi:hypothetical protein
MQAPSHLLSAWQAFGVQVLVHFPFPVEQHMYVGFQTVQVHEIVVVAIVDVEVVDLVVVEVVVVFTVVLVVFIVEVVELLVIVLGKETVK